MSEAEANLATSVLLPAANVVVFSNDKITLDASNGIAQDWRFARVHTTANQGDVQTAIDTYAESASPDLIMIQTDIIDESFTDKLGELAGLCNEGTAAIVIGPDNDVNLYRKLIDMGISDYLVRPLETEQIADVIAKTLIEKLGVSGSRLIAFVGSKGGVGTSTLAQCAAWCAAENLDQKTLFLDAAGGWSTASVSMGFEPVTTLAEAVGAAENNDEDSLNRMIVKSGEKLDVLASGGEIMLETGMSGAELERLLDYTMAKYPVVIIDLSQSLPALMYTVLNKANHIVLGSTGSVLALRLTRSLLQEIKNVRGDDAHNVSLFINMYGQTSGHEVPKKDIPNAIGIEPAGIIAHDPSTFGRSESEGKRLIEHKEGQALAHTYLRPLLQTILGLSETTAASSSDNGSGFMGLFDKLKNK